MPPTPAEARTPTDRDWHTDELPATAAARLPHPGRTLDRGARRRCATLGADLGIELVAYKRRIGRYLLWRAGPGACAPTRATWPSRPTTSTSGGRSGSRPTAPARAPARTARRTRASARGRRRCVTTAANALTIRSRRPASGRGTRAAGRITIRARSRACAGDARRRRRVERALDVACGTGMSTRALADDRRRRGRRRPFARDARRRRAVGAAGAVLRADRRRDAAVRRPRSFDAVTCARACTGSTSRGSSPKCAGCCAPGGWVALYDHYFIGEMVDVPEFAEWSARRARALPAAAAQPAGRRSALPRRPAGFEKVGDEFFADDIEMTQQQFVDYQLSISNFVAAGERGTPRDELRAWLLESTAPFYDGVPSADRALPRLRHLPTRRRS